MKGIEELKREIILSAIKTKQTIVKTTGISNAVAFCGVMFGLIGALWMYLYNPNLNGYAIWGMFGLLSINIIVLAITAHMATND